MAADILALLTGDVSQLESCLLGLSLQPTCFTHQERVELQRVDHQVLF